MESLVWRSRRSRKAADTRLIYIFRDGRLLSDKSLNLKLRVSGWSWLGFGNRFLRAEISQEVDVGSFASK